MKCFHGHMHVCKEELHNVFLLGIDQSRLDSFYASTLLEKSDVDWNDEYAWLCAPRSVNEHNPN